MESQTDSEVSAAEAAERRLAGHLREIEERVLQLDAECDEWRRRALAAEATLEQLTAALDHTSAVDNNRPPQPAVRRLRGNWLR